MTTIEGTAFPIRDVTDGGIQRVNRDGTREIVSTFEYFMEKGDRPSSPGIMLTALKGHRAFPGSGALTLRENSERSISDNNGATTFVIHPRPTSPRRKEKIGDRPVQTVLEFLQQLRMPSKDLQELRQRTELLTLRSR